MSKVFFSLVCVLMVAYAFVKFAGHGAFGPAALQGYGRLLAVTELVMLPFIALNLGLLRRAPALVAVICIWLPWTLFTFLHMPEYGEYDVMIGILEVMYCPLFFLFFYILIKKNPEMFRATVAFFALLLGIVSLLFLYVFRYFDIHSPTRFFQLNDAYYALLLLPWVMLWRRAWWKYAGILLVTAVVAWSMKRGAIICLVLGLGAYFLTGRLQSRRLFDVRWLIGCVFAAFIVFMLMSYVGGETKGYFMSRMESAFEDAGSGRLEIYANVLRLQSNSELSYWILGHGHDSVRRYNSSRERDYGSAHNDWQEVLFDYGVPALLLYAAMHLLLLRSLLEFIKSGSPLAGPMAVSYTIFFFMSLGSHLVLYASYFSYLMALWGALFALQERQRSLRCPASPKGDPCVMRVSRAL